MNAPLPLLWAAGLRALGLGALGLLASGFAASALADDTARLPRPRPALAETPSPQAAEDAAAPLPRPRPEDESAAAWAGGLEDRFRAAEAALDDPPASAELMLAEAPEAFAAIDSVARIPRPRPDPSMRLSMVAPDAQTGTPGSTLAPRVVEPEAAACLVRLRALGVAFTEQEPIAEGECVVRNPLTVTGLGSGVEITPSATLNCRTAEALALWTRDVLVSSALDLLGATPTAIVHGSAYVCRTRNNDPDAKISEHAFANAVDISTIRFDGREPLRVANRDMESVEGRFQVAIRGGSCDYFTTVLGPRSNAAHETHLHFDMAQRRSGYRLCDLADTNFVGAAEP